MSNQYKYADKDYSITDKDTAPLYSRWMSMNGRCRDKGHSSYSNYGGKGVRVCETWRNDFHAFREWALRNGFRPWLSLDRINPGGNYAPENCRWISQTENRKRARFVRGEQCHTAKLTEDDVLEAHRLHKDGWSFASISRLYGVKPDTIGRAIRGDTWGHLRAIVESKVLDPDE